MSTEARAALVRITRRCHAQGLGAGTTGNMSQRSGRGFLITPSGVAAENLRPRDIVYLDMDGAVIEGDCRPSSEWRLHRDIYAGRAEAQAVVHTHSPYATALSCLRRDIPSFHYMVSAAGGVDIRCADYATFGTPALAQTALIALQDRTACLLANHGQVALGASLDAAFVLAETVEDLARQYCLALQCGQPVMLDADEMQCVVAQFSRYGQATEDD